MDRGLDGRNRIHSDFIRGNQPNSPNPRSISELAAQINHFEGSGVKRAKHGEPDRMALAKEVQDVIRCALQVADYYDLDAELAASVEKSYQQHLKNVLTERFD